MTARERDRELSCFLDCSPHRSQDLIERSPADRIEIRKHSRIHLHRQVPVAIWWQQ
jgi:hypothetical protein